MTGEEIQELLLLRTDDLEYVLPMLPNRETRDPIDIVTPFRRNVHLEALVGVLPAVFFEVRVDLPAVGTS